MGCVAIGWPARSSAYRMNRTPFDGAPGTTAGSFASYWNVVAFHVYVVPNTTAGGKIDAAMVPLDGTSAARSAMAASRLSASERARPRSEEYTSELQSRGQLVCRLLREKKTNTESHRQSQVVPGNCEAVSA